MFRPPPIALFKLVSVLILHDQQKMGMSGFGFPRATGRKGQSRAGTAPRASTRPQQVQ